MAREILRKGAMAETIQRLSKLQDTVQGMLGSPFATPRLVRAGLANITILNSVVATNISGSFNVPTINAGDLLEITIQGTLQNNSAATRNYTVSVMYGAAGAEVAIAALTFSLAAGATIWPFTGRFYIQEDAATPANLHTNIQMDFFTAGASQTTTLAAHNLERSLFIQVQFAVNTATQRLVSKSIRALHLPAV